MGDDNLGMKLYVLNFKTENKSLETRVSIDPHEVVEPLSTENLSHPYRGYLWATKKPQSFCFNMIQTHIN